MEENRPKDRTWYVCDPVKNTGCGKRSCVHNPEAAYWACDRTSNPAFAVLDESGEPVKMDAKSGSALPVFRDGRLLARLSGKNDAPCKRER